MAKKAENNEAEMMPNFEVIKPFKDAAKHVVDGQTPKRYPVGSDVSHFHPSRLECLIKRGLVKENKLND